MDKEIFDKVAQISEKMKSLEIINKQIKDTKLPFVGDCYDIIIPLGRKEEKL